MELSFLEIIALVCSRVSIFGWVLAGVYQLYLGYKNKGTGFSPMFLIGYVVGDICNVFGCFWGNQMAFQKVIVVTTLVSDSLMALQYVYYKKEYPKIRSSGNMQMSSSIVAASMFGISHAVVTTTTTSVPPAPPHFDYRFLVGQVMAWCAQLFYIGGVIPQVYRNFTKKCTGGVSKFLFVADLVGSVGYIATLLATAQGMDKHDSIQFLFDELAYLLGTSVCLVMDLVLLVQYIIYPEYLVEVLDGESESTALAPQAKEYGTCKSAGGL